MTETKLIELLQDGAASEGAKLVALAEHHMRTGDAAVLAQRLGTNVDDVKWYAEEAAKYGKVFVARKTSASPLQRIGNTEHVPTPSDVVAEYRRMYRKRFGVYPRIGAPDYRVVKAKCLKRGVPEVLRSLRDGLQHENRAGFPLAKILPK